MRSMYFRHMILALVLICSACSPAYAADCGQALFGWTLNSGGRIEGTLANEGVSRENPLGRQNLKSDPGNYRWKHGRRVNCGGTVAGLTCRDHPNLDMRHITMDQVVAAYHGNEWAEIRGDEWKSQYGAYKVFDVGVNCGKGSAALCLVDTINALNGKSTDFRRRPVVTRQMIEWVNEYTRSDVLPWDHEPRYPGDYGPRGHDSTRRQLFFKTFELKVMEHYGDIIARNPTMARWWKVWKRRLTMDE